MIINLKTYNTILRKSILAEKQKFLIYTFNKYKSDIKNTWNTLNEVLSRNCKHKYVPSSFVVGNTLISNKVDIANQFNSFFTNIGVDIANQINYVGEKTFKHYLHNDANDLFSFSNVSEQNVLEILNNLAPKNSSGSDSISTKFFKQISSIVGKSNF